LLRPFSQERGGDFAHISANLRQNSFAGRQSVIRRKSANLTGNPKFPEADFWPAMTSGLPVISELSSGCFQVKSAPQFSRSGYHDLDAQKIQALAVKKPCQRSASLLLC